ncbi:MAG: discoidin domain-containing protein [Pirellulaceae bacterium]
MLRLTAFLLGIAWFATICPAEEKKVPLQTDLPREVLAGTPPNVLVMLFPGLELPPDKAPELLVPEGTKNLALKKKITSSESDPILGKLEFVTDGNKEGSEESFVELSPGTQWVQIDLEKPAKIYAIYLWHFFREARSYHDVIVQVADDAEFTKNVQTVYNSDADASSKLGVGKDRSYIETYMGRLIDAKGVTGRYVRLYSHGNTANSMNHYVEVEVFAKPAS